MSMSQSKVRPLAFLAAVGLAAVLISAVVAVEVDAARGGKGGGKGGGQNGGGTTATVTVAPNPVPLGSTSFVFSGSGFGANQTLVIGVSGMCCLQEVTTDTIGAFSVDYPFWAGYPGVCYGAGAWNKDMTTVLGSTSFCITTS